MTRTKLASIAPVSRKVASSGEEAKTHESSFREGIVNGLAVAGRKEGSLGTLMEQTSQVASLGATLQFARLHQHGHRKSGHYERLQAASLGGVAEVADEYR